MITGKDIIGIIVIILMFSLYYLFKDDPKKGLEDAGKIVDKLSDSIKRLIRGIEKI
jgi:hypothetical protein